jgi:hypothetical protein
MLFASHDKSVQSGRDAEQYRAPSPVRAVTFVGAVVVLLVVASVFLLAWVGLGITAGEIMLNPNAR